jgi:hypothetical protein
MPSGSVESKYRSKTGLDRETILSFLGVVDIGIVDAVWLIKSPVVLFNFMEI